jgi:mannose-1-phosphate guanylyltransferase
MVHQIAALAAVGVKEVILAINYQSELIQEHLDSYAKEFNIKITCSKEDEPMGTGGPLRIAKDIIKEGNEDGMFFCFNSDVICDFPLKQMIEAHKTHGKEGTLVTTKVEEPSRFGVVLSDSDGKITDFVEKPQEFVGNDINAGLYLFNTSIIDRIENRPTSIEREIFPIMASQGELYTLQLEGFWKDIGQPIDFLIGAKLYLKHLSNNNDERLSKGENFRECVLIHPTAIVADDAVIGPNVSIGENCIIESGARIKDSCIFPNTKISAHAYISESIIGRSSSIGKWTRVEQLAVIADDVKIKDELFINGSKILPHKSVDKSYYSNGDILM